MLKINNTPGFNIWDFIKCPICGSQGYESQDYAKVSCITCSASFTTKAPSADPGVVVYCSLEDFWIYSNTFNLDEEFIAAFKLYDFDIYTQWTLIRAMYWAEVKKSGVFRLENYPEDEQKKFERYQEKLTKFLKETLSLGRVMKTGEYDSGWFTVLERPSDKSAYKWEQASNSEKWFDYLYMIGFHKD